MEFIHNPSESNRLGDWLKDNLERDWTHFRAAVAFVKRSGTRHIAEPLATFAERGHIEIVAGIDHRGTSYEGLLDLLRAVMPNGRIVIFHNRLLHTFHPKIYVFKSETAADLVVGSGNLTEGGLFTNYEAALRLKLNLFAAVPVHAAPRMQSPKRRAGTTIGRGNVHAPELQGSQFLMTLQRTDVGVGQTSPGTSRRSPEIFIPLVARNANPTFWDWPDGFVQDDSMPGKFDRRDVRMRLDGKIVIVNMMYWPPKHEFRLRSEALRSAGHVGDILRMGKASPEDDFDYDVEVIPSGADEYPSCFAKCDQLVRNSKKRFSYY